MAQNAPLTGPGAPAPPPSANQRVVPGHWHWNGVEWQWTPERLEEKAAPFDWKRQ